MSSLELSEGILQTKNFVKIKTKKNVDWDIDIIKHFSTSIVTPEPSYHSSQSMKEIYP